MCQNLDLCVKNLTHKGTLYWCRHRSTCIHLSGHLSIHLSYVHPYYHFWMINWVTINRFWPNLVCALILWRSGLGLLLGKFRSFLTVICPPHNSGGILLFHVYIVFVTTLFSIMFLILSKVSLRYWVLIVFFFILAFFFAYLPTSQN